MANLAERVAAKMENGQKLGRWENLRLSASRDFEWNVDQEQKRLSRFLIGDGEYPSDGLLPNLYAALENPAETFSKSISTRLVYYHTQQPVEVAQLVAGVIFRTTQLEGEQTSWMEVYGLRDIKNQLEESREDFQLARLSIIDARSRERYYVDIKVKESRLPQHYGVEVYLKQSLGDVQLNQLRRNRVQSVVESLTVDHIGDELRENFVDDDSRVIEMGRWTEEEAPFIMIFNGFAFGNEWQTALTQAEHYGEEYALSTKNYIDEASPLRRGLLFTPTNRLGEVVPALILMQENDMTVVYAVAHKDMQPISSQ